ncbi:MAG TPA: DUF4160 domain-containing protein [Steroidobacteraceae bacterium]
MPEISRFLGIVITMSVTQRDPPHFRVRYADYRAKVMIESLQLCSGDLPSRVYALVLRWARLHQDELMENWNRLATEGVLEPIAPLV